jgi:uncharacterized protein (DUF2141 family)
MKVNNFIPFLLIAAVLYSTIFIGSTGCANIVPPSGGLRDSLPPVLISALPKDSAKNVTTQKISILFNEFIELREPSQKILISPFPGKQVETEVKLKNVIVRLKDTLLPNTTYVIDFGNAIVDLNEGNVLKNFRYVFSTGTSIDSNELTGKIVNAENGKTDSTFFAVLYRKQEDSTVAKEKPIYVTRVDSKGNFQFTNLPSGTFYVYALQDADGDKRYNQPTEPFAFLDSAVVVNRESKNVLLHAFAAEREKSRPAATIPAKPEKGVVIKRLLYTTNLESGSQDLLDSFKLSYQKPLRNLDTSQIILVKDSTTFVKEYKIKNDTANKRIVIFTNWQEGANYTLFLNKTYAEDSSGLKPNKDDTIKFRVKAEKEYGSIRLRFKNLDLTKNPVLLLYSGEQLVGSYPLTSNEWLRKLYKPGEYQVRILFDANKNGVWTTGNFFSKPRKQPELVQSINSTIVIKPNWDNEANIDLANDPKPKEQF